jgi:hypothetical protein
MSASSSITPVRAGHRVEFGTHKMTAAGPTMTTPAKNPDIINEILFHQPAKISIPGRCSGRSLPLPNGPIAQSQYEMYFQKYLKI